ncbi:MAG: trimeric intracellular cation channel family protein [Lachnospiraceae bacterium]|nr:trimeric intracellular cation channel family protein [Lachnospiraceae bacterium]
MDIQTLIIFAMEMIGTVAFAASGAMVGVGRRMDIFGVCVLGVVTSVGGGMIRDVFLGIIPPGVFQKPVYALVATITSCMVFMVLYINRHLLEGHFKEIYDRVLLVMDSIGLGIFTVVGVNTGIQQGYLDHTFLLVFLGTITGVGGGLLRDMMAGVPPYIFVRHVYACASIVGAWVCAVMSQHFSTVEAMVISAAVVMLIRYLAAHYHWNLPRLEEET